VDLSHVEILVLDEADRMLDMGFIRDIRKILALLPARRQNLLFSATFSDEIKQLADGLLNSPELIEVARRNTAAELVAQIVHPVDRARKRKLLSHLIHSQGWKQVLVFTRTKHGANRLAEQLEKDGINSSAIHGNKSQGARTKALADFKQGVVRVLVATDIAARGLDIDQLPHVVNYELPNVPEDYVHRIGRTGRAGKEGEAIPLVCVDERDYLRDIERLLTRDIPKVMITGFEPDPSIQAEPISHGRGQRGGGRPQTPRQGGDQRRGQRPSSNPHARAGGQRPASPSQPHARTGGKRPSAHAQPHDRAGGQRSTTFSQPRTAFAGDRYPRDESPQIEVDGNRKLPESVDGNRRSPESPRDHDRDRHYPDKSPAPQPQARPVVTTKPVRRREREVPALFGGGKHDD
jgi:ATP-dependent RNA helicase RhlE